MDKNESKPKNLKCVQILKSLGYGTSYKAPNNNGNFSNLKEVNILGEKKGNDFMYKKN